MKFKEWVQVVGIAIGVSITTSTLFEMWLDQRLDNAYHERRAAEERIDLLEQVIAARVTSEAAASASYKPVATATTMPARPDPTAEPLLREVDIWPELAYDGVVDAGCKGLLVTLYPNNEYLHNLVKLRFRDMGNELGALRERFQDIEREGFTGCAEAQWQVENFLTMRQESLSRWRLEHWLPYPGLCAAHGGAPSIGDVDPNCESGEWE